MRRGRLGVVGQQSGRAFVCVAVEVELTELPRAYSKDLYDQKCDLVYQQIYDSY